MDDINVAWLCVYNTETQEWWENKVYLFPDHWTAKQISEELYQHAFAVAQKRGYLAKQLNLECDICICERYKPVGAMREVMNLQEPDVSWVITEKTLFPSA